jgi:hypothetical protein
VFNLQHPCNLNTQAQKREERIMKRLNSFYKFVLLLSFAMAPSTALALDPVIIIGNKTPAAVPINAVNTWNTLLTTTVAIPNDGYDCAVTCTSTVTNPHAANDQDYFYAAFNNNAAANPVPADACVRRFDFDQNPGGVDKLDHLVVASTCFIPNLPPGNQSFYCLGRKEPGQVNTSVLNSSMTVICVPDQG